MLNDEEKNELMYMAASDKLREDMRRLSKSKHNPFVVNGSVDMDRLLTFLNEYNYFVNHAKKPFRRIKDMHVRL